MPFPPHTEDTVLERNTLHQVVCQLRFPKILAITADEPVGFQNRVRGKFPDYQVLREAPEGLPDELRKLLKTQTPPTYSFSMPDNRLQLTLSQDFLALTDNSYQNWSDFQYHLEEATFALIQEYKPHSYLRIGLRYINVIIREQLGLEATPWSDLLHLGVLGQLGDPETEAEVLECQNNSVLDLGLGVLARLKAGLGTMDQHERVFILDADFFIQERKPIDESSAILGTLHDRARDFFSWAVRPALFKVLIGNGPRRGET